MIQCEILPALAAIAELSPSTLVSDSDALLTAVGNRRLEYCSLCVSACSNTGRGEYHVSLGTHEAATIMRRSAWQESCTNTSTESGNETHHC